MALSRSRRFTSTNYWPGFVDAMATLLLVIIFLLSIFILVQFFQSQEIDTQNEALNQAEARINELLKDLAIERSTASDLRTELAGVSATLSDLEARRSLLESQLEQAQAGSLGAEGQLGSLQSALDAEKQMSAQALSRIDLLNQQIAALRRQIAALEDALDASENRDRESQARIADLGKRLNVALAQKVQELSRFRSDFFGRLRTILADRSDIRVVGDRFVFQSEVLFPAGSDGLNPEGTQAMAQLAEAIIELESQIPSDINWVLRVDGHTDNRPIRNNPRFPTNWELSSARAISVVRFLVDQGVSPNRLVAAGFGEFQPIDAAETDEAYARNRRIELKLTER
jgi:chemotaxis protein MotB